MQCTTYSRSYKDFPLVQVNIFILSVSVQYNWDSSPPPRNLDNPTQLVSQHFSVSAPQTPGIIIFSDEVPGSRRRPRLRRVRRHRAAGPRAARQGIRDQEHQVRPQDQDQLLQPVPRDHRLQHRGHPRAPATEARKVRSSEYKEKYLMTQKYLLHLTIKIFCILVDTLWTAPSGRT